MKIPNILKVDGHKIKVRMIKDGEIKVEDRNINGMVDKKNCLMVLNENMTRSMVEETFFHEALHLCDDYEDPLPETRIDAIARRLYALLKNNNLLRNDKEEDTENNV
jgi:hypothetical protein